MKNLLTILSLGILSFAAQTASAQSLRLELPAGAQNPPSGCIVSTQEFQDGTPSHTYLYDPGKRISLWVAYPLNKGLIGEGSRGEGWHPYDGIPENLQASLRRGFRYGSGFDRGHQIPSADRLDPYINESTFVYVNATPQLHNFNGGLWAELEKLVRTWAKRSDTLYVVTGVIPGTKTIEDNLGAQINIPRAYYKTVLRENTDRTGRVHWLMCSVILDHREQAVGTWQENAAFFRSRSVSVDELERLTGEDFFPALKDVIGQFEADALERANPADFPWWWR